MCPGEYCCCRLLKKAARSNQRHEPILSCERNANSAIVVGIDRNVITQEILAGIRLQRELESAAYVLGGENYGGPAENR